MDAAQVRQALARAFRKDGNTVFARAQYSYVQVEREFWIIGDKAGKMVVVNCNAAAKLGMGCYGHPDYRGEQQRLIEIAERVIGEVTSLPMRRGGPDQIILDLA